MYWVPRYSDFMVQTANGWIISSNTDAGVSEVDVCFAVQLTHQVFTFILSLLQLTVAAENDYLNRFCFLCFSWLLFDCLILEVLVVIWPLVISTTVAAWKDIQYG